MFQIAKPASALFAASLLGAVAFCQPALAQNATSPGQSAAPSGSTAAPAAAPKTKTVTPSHKRASGIEAYLSRLHKKLMITPAQQQQWDAYANVERDKVKTMQSLSTERNANLANMTAVDDLHSYEKFTEANADAVKKLVPAFEALYNSMSDAQKKNADEYFAQVEQRKQQRHAHHAAK
ncbi:MAG TPA: Spy/CpxP family protein refolding chaperone [Candidatus Sulfotelmatobacter sp.]|nr:Spy/CpxP family protein refolding chaperone [Candidatus Sulfotelmatobacter sp.]